MLSFEVPDEKVIIGEAFTYSFTVQNTGTSTGEFSTLITIVNDEGISHPYKPFEWTATIEPGETVTFESEPLTSWWDSSPWYIQLSAFDAEQSVWFSRPRLEFGEWFELGNGLRMTMQYDVDEVHFDHETVAFCPDQSHAYVWVEVEVPDGVGWPDYYQLFLLSGGEWAYAKMGRHPGYYLYGVPESSTKTGWLTFEVSETFSENDVTVSWEDEDAIGSTGAYWTNNPAALP
ncbi:hypothetical protein ACFQH3_12125 [Haladaptatus sp. GCM10025707]|uniref:hypothetical protein n=1 Tax=unclassified Haladaptatus TaxID=2622732 RepID=UPI0023E8D976|nr:hypothetical protein [Haladaptatus sp. QDMS2]